MTTETLYSADGIKESAYDPAIPRWRGHDGGLLNIRFNARFDRDLIRTRKPDLWRYREAIPLHQTAQIVTLGEGFTPLLPLSFGGKTAWIKQEQLSPTGSYKDRGASVLISKALSLGIRHVVQDSSGNAGCAIAAYAARAGIPCDIYLPEATSAAKTKQIEAYGARIFRIAGNRKATADAALVVASQTYYASHCYNPYFLQGTKTFAYEVCEQLNWQAPDVVVIPTGNGTLLLGCLIGFRDLKEAGITDRIPKLIAVQAANCSPLANLFEEKPADTQPIHPTYAEGIAISEPIRGREILDAVKGTKGCFIRVTEAEIQRSHATCGHMGFYIEPTAAAGIAGLQKYLESSEGETVVSLFSGHGLKK